MTQHYSTMEHWSACGHYLKVL